MRAGFLWALAAIPFSVALGALAIELDVFVRLFFDSKWFAFKAAFGGLELLVFSLVAAIKEQQLASGESTGSENAV